MSPAARKATTARQYATPPAQIGGPAPAEPEVLDGDVLPPFDLDEDTALDVEAAGAATVQVRLSGRTIDFPLMKEWPLSAVDKVTQKRVVINGREQLLPADMLGALTELFPGDEKLLAVFRALPLRKVERLVDYIVEVSGVGPGESSPSARRSGSSRRR